MSDADLVRLVDALEASTASYLTLDEVEAATHSELSPAIERHLLLVDYRTRADGTQVTLCRLNRRHSLVKELTGW